MLKVYFKHSSRCPISLNAKRQVRAFLGNNRDKIKFEEIDVINNKTRSEEVQKLYDIEHESPQIIVIDTDNNVVWSGSHYDITEQKLVEIINI